MRWNGTDFRHQDLTGQVIGVFYQVYNELGHGFLESVYENAMEIALSSANLHVKRQFPLPVFFRGLQIGDFRADLLVEEAVIVEVKAARSLEPVHEAQLLNYLRASQLEIGLLLNFGPEPQIKRFVFSNDRKRRPEMKAEQHKSVAG